MGQKHVPSLVGIAGLIPRSLHFQAQVTLAEADVASQENARSNVRIDQCVTAMGAVGLPVFVCLHISCNPCE